jgi:tRNA-2-methylthio-N6-dimethylallyladenosine synthase
MKSDIVKRPLLAEARKRTKGDSLTVSYHADPLLHTIGKGKHYLIHTYGCQANESDTERMRGILVELGYVPTTEETNADLILLNTCAIRASAESKVYGELGRLKQLKEANPNLILAVGGCMPQEEETVAKILKTYHQVDIVFGTHNLHRLGELVRDAMQSQRTIVDVPSEEGIVLEDAPLIRANPVKAWINIMSGCDEFCTYCIVPYTRGKERSRRPEAILKELSDLIEKGYREVTLLGQNVNSYGLDFVDGSIRFSDLLERVRQLPIERIRFTTSHPKDFSNELIAVLAKGGNLMPFIHLPVQSGSDTILKRMNRKYTRESYLSLIRNIRDAIPHVSLTTDIIVGFPGETDADFEATLSLVEEAGFEGAYTFMFSARAGTPAASYTDTIPKEIKKARLQRLNELVNKQFKAGNLRFEGSVVDVLIDGVSKTDPGMLSGYTPHNKIVHFRGEPSLVGTIRRVKILKAKTWSLDGELHDET